MATYTVEFEDGSRNHLVAPGTPCVVIDVDTLPLSYSDYAVHVGDGVLHFFSEQNPAAYAMKTLPVVTAAAAGIGADVLTDYGLSGKWRAGTIIA